MVYMSLIGNSDSCDHSFERVGEEYGPIADHLDTTDDYVIAFSKVYVTYECSNEGCNETKRNSKKHHDLTKIPLEEINTRKDI